MGVGGMSDETIPEFDPVRACDACQQSYVVSHLGDTGICRLCEVRETGLRNMDDYQQAVLDKIRQSITVKSRNDL